VLPPLVLLDLAAKRGIQHHVRGLEDPQAFTAMITQGLSLEEYQSVSQLLRDYHPGNTDPLRSV
jgi:hypothetical protein